MIPLKRQKKCRIFRQRRRLSHFCLLEDKRKRNCFGSEFGKLLDWWRGSRCVAAAAADVAAPICRERNLNEKDACLLTCDK